MLLVLNNEMINCWLNVVKKRMPLSNIKVLINDLNEKIYNNFDDFWELNKYSG